MIERLSVKGTEWDTHNEVLHVYNPHALTQIAGYVKYQLAIKNKIVHYRGQDGIYAKKMYPSIFRANHTNIKQDGIDRLIRIIKEYISVVGECGAFQTDVKEYAYEPILQQYGIKTRWLDLVDNIWVALWFSCYSIYLGPNKASRYANFEKRNPAKDNNKFAYIFILGFEYDKTGHPGYYSGKSIDVIDLRMAIPSTYIRPHAQHGLLCKLKGDTNRQPIDMSSYIVDVIIIRIDDALSWLGDGEMLRVHTLFPPPTYDLGYAQLLDKSPKGNQDIGNVLMIGS
ncbi:MAG: FRG domain-containing protein [Magnetococcales bacterium]|nr:FRG domain-containing protein [Magnetococcales bacterium]